MEVSIIGAGPIGCISALYGIEEHDISIYEGRRERRMQCSGLISKDGLLSLGIPIKKSVIQNRIRGAKLFSPSGMVVEIDGRTTKAYVIDRVGFDNYLIDKILGFDVDIIEKQVRLKDIADFRGHSDMVVLATGTNYSLHRSLGLDMPKEFLFGAQYEMMIECDSEFVELHFNIPDFFSWIIPVDEYARVGVCLKTNPLPYLHKFIEGLGNEGRIHNYSIRDEHYGLIPIHNPSMRTKYGDLLLVGDAAGHVKASTGGGIVMGGKAARHIYSEDYEREWRKHIGNELRLHLMIHRFLSRLSDKNKDRLFSIINEHKYIIEEKGDMDSAYKSLSALFRNPTLIAKFISSLPAFIYDLL